MSSSEQQRCCAGPSPCNSGRRRWFQSCIVRPTTGRDCCCKTAATVEESTPPDMAIATRPGCVSALTGRVSNWVAVSIDSILSDCSELRRNRREVSPLHEPTDSSEGIGKTKASVHFGRNDRYWRFALNDGVGKSGRNDRLSTRACSD